MYVCMFIDYTQWYKIIRILLKIITNVSSLTKSGQIEHKLRRYNFIGIVAILYGREGLYENPPHTATDYAYK